MNRSSMERNRRNCSRPLTSTPISKHNFEIPVDNYVVKNEHSVLLMNRPL